MSARSILRTVIGSIDILGNSVVCIVIAKVPAMRTLTNAFIFNQALIDLLGSLFMVLHNNIRAPKVLHPNAVIATIQCYIWQSNVILWVLYVASTLNLVALTSERYLAIVYPFKYVTYFGRKQATGMLVAVWVLAIGYKGTNAFYYRMEDRACVFASLSTAANVAWGTIAFLVEYLIPLIFMTFCYVHIILQLKKASTTVHAEPSTSQESDNSMSGSLLRARRNTLKTLFIVFVTYTICWSPNQIAFLVYNLGFQLNFSGAFYFTSLALVQLNCCINPFIYTFKYKQLQTGVRLLLEPCCPKLAPKRQQESVAIIAVSHPQN
ncbi:allatostatin-A receptor-like [Patiria miniata]|uniref:G-protein coupled receptors family 1 profile domain-containing protein n=1 Tax=Patiria miniata TaxID=46514 RepID=A0A913Z2D1_PATMI|nr:allatostatin-A receptor-like [Patiria miniata]